jgi:hypothetical protein
MLVQFHAEIQFFTNIYLQSWQIISHPPLCNKRTSLIPTFQHPVFDVIFYTDLNWRILARDIQQTIEASSTEGLLQYKTTKLMSD